MKGKIVLIQFPFDDLSSSKVRPAYCLTNTIGAYQHIIFALITSRIPHNPLHTDIILTPENSDFIISGLRKSSTIRLDHRSRNQKRRYHHQLATSDRRISKVV
jgi:mRNA interferase MazF